VRNVITRDGAEQDMALSLPAGVPGPEKAFAAVRAHMQAPDSGEPFDILARFVASVESVRWRPPERRPFLQNPADLLDAAAANPKALSPADRTALGSAVYRLGWSDKWRPVADAVRRLPGSAELLRTLAAARASSGDRAGALALLDEATAARPPKPDTDLQAVTDALSDARIHTLVKDRPGAVSRFRAAFAPGRPPLKLEEPPARGPGLNTDDGRGFVVRLGREWTYAGDATSAWRYADTLPPDDPARAALRAGVMDGLLHRLTGVPVQRSTY
jgi:hypothetical protein